MTAYSNHSENLDNTAKIRQSAEAIRGDVLKTVQHAKEGARVVAEEAKIRANEYTNIARDHLSETQDIIVDRIRKQPLQAGLAAAGVGFLLALLLKK